VVTGNVHPKAEDLAPGPTGLITPARLEGRDEPCLRPWLGGSSLRLGLVGQPEHDPGTGAPLFERHAVDIVLSGYKHHLEYLDPDNRPLATFTAEHRGQTFRHKEKSLPKPSILSAIPAILRAAQRVS
jgi:hypothetical protein